MHHETSLFSAQTPTLHQTKRACLLVSLSSILHPKVSVYSKAKHMPMQVACRFDKQVNAAENRHHGLTDNKCVL